MPNSYNHSTVSSHFVSGSTVLYSVTLRYPLIRDLKYVWYYLDADGKDYPVGYSTSFVVTTTNVVNGLEIETFFRTHYNRYYTVFVDYPMDISCYKNVKILNWYVIILYFELS